VLVTFHKDVSVSASDFSIVGDHVGALTFSFSYDPVTFTATLTPDAPYPPDTYTLTITDTVLAADSGQALDGEIEPQAGTLPSGDGVPGGDAVTTFVVVPVDCPGDVDNTGDVTLDDFTVIASNFGAGPDVTRAEGDLTGDGFVTLADFTVLAENFGLDCNN